MKKMSFLCLAIILAACFLSLKPRTARAAGDRSFEPGALIIPMDLAYQDQGMFQAYGLLYQLLRQGIEVHWVIAKDKVWHHAPCDTPGACRRRE